MPSPASIRVVQLLAAAALATSLLTPAAARPEQKQPNQQQQLEERLKAAEARLEAAEKKADHAEMQKDYIERIQKETKDYYDKAFNTQAFAVTVIALFVGLVGKFGVDHIVASKLTEAKSELRSEYAQGLEAELQKLERSNREQFRRLEKDSISRSNYQFYFGQGQSSGADNRYDDALKSFRWALETYKSGKGRLFTTGNGGRLLRNICVSIAKLHPDSYVNEVKKELTDKLYDDLEDELNYAAVRLEWLRPIVEERLPTGPADRDTPATSSAAPEEAK